MNERIKQLAEQCTVSCIDGRGVELNEIDVEKFAELIVRECADTVTDRCEMRNESDVKRAEYYAKRIKEHFGVEE